MRAVVADQELRDQGARTCIKMGRPKRCKTISVRDLTRFAQRYGACFYGSDRKLRFVIKFKGNGGQQGYLASELYDLLSN